GAGRVCSPSNACVQCTAAKGCSAPNPICDESVSGGRCVQCLSSAHCSGTEAVCDTATQRCVGCVSNGDCGGDVPLCDSATKSCIGCKVDGDCPPAKPLCNTNQRCASCLNDSQCGPNKICSQQGSCDPTPETCATAEALTLPVPGSTYRFTIDTSAATDD